MIVPQAERLARAEKLTALLVDSLWDSTAGNGHDIGRVGVAAPPSGGNFVNRLPGRAYPSVDGGSDVFYQRVSPTSFYPLVGPSSCIPPNGTLTVATSSQMTGGASMEQAHTVAADWLLDPKRFCITAVADWPPKETPFPTDHSATLQSHQNGDTGDWATCAAASGAMEGAPADYTCEGLQARGYSKTRDEAVGLR